MVVDERKWRPIAACWNDMPSSIRKNNTSEAWKMIGEACRWSEWELGKVSVSAKLPSGNAKFDRLANHPQTPGLLEALPLI